MFFNEELGAIRSILSGYEGPGGITLPWDQMLIYLLAWYLFTITTYGVAVPAGLFLPGIIIGCAVGSIYEDLVHAVEQEDESGYTYAVIPILLAVGAMLSSYCRMTYSLVVVMLETTSAVNIFAPMIISVMVSRAVANLFTPSLYMRAIQSKGVPMLPAKAPLQLRGIEIQEFMNTDVLSVPTLISIDQLKTVIQAKHSAFPVTNTANRLVGLISRHSLTVLAREKVFYDKSHINHPENFRSNRQNQQQVPPSELQNEPMKRDPVMDRTADRTTEQLNLT